MSLSLPHSYHKANAGRMASSPIAVPPAPYRTTRSSRPVIKGIRERIRHGHEHMLYSLSLSLSPTPFYLIELDMLGQTARANRVEKTKRAQRIDLARILGHVKGDLDMGLRGKVVDFRGTHLRDDVHETSAIGEIAVVKNHLGL